MNTPICDFVTEYAQSGKMRLHMPGHKGQGDYERFDITEFDGADVLYNASGIIRESEDNAASLFGTQKTLYSTEGSSLSIRAMMYLALLYAKQNGKKPVIAAGRNAHKSFITAAVLLGFEPEWIYPADFGSVLSCNITPLDLENAIKKMSEPPTAVYITSPDYLGNIADIKGIAKVCKKYGALLLVDNAHGAYLGFLTESLHPIALGADIVCDSAHKTLPVLTGGAYLHIATSVPEYLTNQAEQAMALFASTSPSYLVLQSLDAANKYLSDGFSQELAAFIPAVNNLKNSLLKAGYTLIGTEPLKVTVNAKKYGYYGYEIAQILSENGIICEFYDADFVVMMLSPKNSLDELLRLKKALVSVSKKNGITEGCPHIKKPVKICSPREAFLSACREVSAEDSLGKVFASAAISCPPAVPLIISGEQIDENTIELFRYYGIKKCRVSDIPACR
ncbi:MAG: aminotransferase class V-fold PLP-dependent enzyme [Clostridia bacterium]|nr:aminotransferase class V-fold PLP-dependent enzyme [Clostridia bacterium]